jgi:hypothetical protein
VSIETLLRATLTDPQFLAVWLVVVAVSLSILVWDLRTNNDGIAPLMQFVWTLTVLYSGPLGLAVYWFSGRAAIPRDSLWRRAFRSVAHCYSGCGAGEVIGVTLAVGVLALETVGVAALTFGFAYLFGYALTVGPLRQEGVGWGDAITDALYTETPSITVMEVVAVGTDLFLADGAGIGEVLFWSALVFSLSVGFLAAYPVNVLLVALGVKGGMQDPRETRDAATA